MTSPPRVPASAPKVPPKLDAPRPEPVAKAEPKAVDPHRGADPGQLTPDISSGETVSGLEGHPPDPEKSSGRLRIANMITASNDPRREVAKVLLKEGANATKAKIAERSPETALAIDAMGAEVQKLVTLTGVELAKDPAALAKLQGAVAKLGSEGFSLALRESGPGIAKAFTAATGLQAVNKEAAQAVLTALPKVAEKVAPQHAAKVLAATGGIAQKLGIEALEHGAEAVAKGVGKAVAKEGAEVAAKGAAKGAAATGKAVPGLGNIISVGSALLAGGMFVRELFRRPAEGERIAKEGVNTLLQTAGIIFPWVALGGDVLDLGWSVKIAAQDAKSGKVPEGRGEALQMLDSTAASMSGVLGEAGLKDQAKLFDDLRAATDAAKTTPNSANNKAVVRATESAIRGFVSAMSTETGKAADAETNAAQKEAIQSVAKGFDSLAKAIAKSDKAPTDRQPIAEDVASAVQKAAVANAIG